MTLSIHGWQSGVLNLDGANEAGSNRDPTATGRGMNETRYQPLTFLIKIIVAQKDPPRKECEGAGSIAPDINLWGE